MLRHTNSGTITDSMCFTARNKYALKEEQIGRHNSASAHFLYWSEDGYCKSVETSTLNALRMVYFKKCACWKKTRSRRMHNKHELVTRMGAMVAHMVRCWACAPLKLAARFPWAKKPRRDKKGASSSCLPAIWCPMGKDNTVWKNSFHRSFRVPWLTHAICFKKSDQNRRNMLSWFVHREGQITKQIY